MSNKKNEIVSVVRNPDGSWTATGGTSLAAVSVTRPTRAESEAHLEALLTAPEDLATLRRKVAQLSPELPQPELTVWYGSMPESNGKSNWTAILHRKGGEGTLMGKLSEGLVIARSEYPDRVRYEADEMRYLIGELDKEPCILDYNSGSHSGYKPEPKPECFCVEHGLHIEQLKQENRLIAACGEDLLERLVNVTEGSDDPISDEEISEIKATLGLAGEDN